MPLERTRVEHPQLPPHTVPQMFTGERERGGGGVAPRVRTLTAANHTVSLNSRLESSKEQEEHTVSETSVNYGSNPTWPLCVFFARGLHHSRLQRDSK